MKFFCVSYVLRVRPRANEIPY